MKSRWVEASGEPQVQNILATDETRMALEQFEEQR